MVIFEINTIHLYIHFFNLAISEIWNPSVILFCKISCWRSIFSKLSASKNALSVYILGKTVHWLAENSSLNSNLPYIIEMKKKTIKSKLSPSKSISIDKCPRYKLSDYLKLYFIKSYLFGISNLNIKFSFQFSVCTYAILPRKE